MSTSVTDALEILALPVPPSLLLPPKGGQPMLNTVTTTNLVVKNLPLPPSLNNCYTTGRGHGRRVLTTEARSYKQTAALLIRAAAAQAGFVVPPRARLRLRFGFYFARNNRDGDNAVKLVQDAAAEVLGFDDRWVVASNWTKAIDKANPRCDLRIVVLD